jgi:hypothetical protein
MAIENVANIYYELYKAGRRTMKTIPANKQAEVQALIDADAAKAAQTVQQ